MTQQQHTLLLSTHDNAASNLPVQYQASKMIHNGRHLCFASPCPLGGQRGGGAEHRQLPLLLPRKCRDAAAGVEPRLQKHIHAHIIYISVCSESQGSHQIVMNRSNYVCVRKPSCGACINTLQEYVHICSTCL